MLDVHGLLAKPLLYQVLLRHLYTRLYALTSKIRYA